MLVISGVAIRGLCRTNGITIINMPEEMLTASIGVSSGMTVSGMLEMLTDKCGFTIWVTHNGLTFKKATHEDYDRAMDIVGMRENVSRIVRTGSKKKTGTTGK